MSRCLLGPSYSFYLLLIAGAVSSSRAEVVDREDGVKQRFVVTVYFGPVIRVPYDIALDFLVLPQLDFDVSVFVPFNFEPV